MTYPDAAGGAVPTPGPPAGPRPDAVRTVHHVPGTRQQWTIPTAQVTGLLLSLRAAEATGRVVLPRPLGAGRALRAWGRIVRSVQDRAAAGGVVAVATADLDVVAATAVTFGTALREAACRGTDDDLSRLLRREAAPYHCSPEWFVVQLARVHGILTSEDEPTAQLLWDAGAAD